MTKVFLETERLILREMDMSDLSDLMTMLSDIDVMYAWEHAFSLDEGKAWVARRINGYAENGFDYFLAIDKTSGKTIGQIGLLKEVLGDEVLYGVGWILKKTEWKKNYAFEGARALLDYGFRLLDLPEIIADIRPENEPSIKVAEKLGMCATNTVVKIVNGKEMPHVIYRMKNPYHAHANFHIPQKDEKYPLSAITELSEMVKLDLSTRAKLAECGELFTAGYHPLMEAVHLKNSLRLEELISAHGFPVMDVAGKDAVENAWLIVQHTIGRPQFLRNALEFFGTLNGYEIPPSLYAYLYDRVAFYERRPQQYGTQFDYDLTGNFGLWWTENESALAVRRGACGLPPVEDVKKSLLLEGTPQNLPIKEAFRMRVLQERWLLHVGWCCNSDIEKCNSLYSL